MQKTTHVGKNVESFYKYKLFQSDNIVVTLQPKFHYSTYNDSSTYNADLGVFLGHSHEGKKHTSFQEIGIIARKYWGKGIKNPIGYALSLLGVLSLKMVL